MPAVTGPLPGSVPSSPAGVLAVTPSVLQAYGYQEKEYLFSGTAEAYTFTGPPVTDGRWTVAADAVSVAPYTTRIVVFTPVDPGRFSGTVDVEWDNVSVGDDVLADLIYDHATPFRNGDAYVGVSAQFVGVTAAKLDDPVRYASLVDLGDSYSYDMFSQAGMALWTHPGLFGGQRPRALIAGGESQSAGRLTIRE